MHEDREVGLAELLREVRRIEVQSRRLVTDVMAGGYSSAFRGAGIEFSEVREFVEGDDPRSIDWSVTARMGWPFVEKYVDERERTVLFLLDLSASMLGGFGPWSARMMATRVCACIALAAIRNNDKVGLIAFQDGVDRFLPAKKGASHVLRLIRECLALRSGGRVTNLVPALELAGHVLRRKAVVFVISDFIASGWPEPLGLFARRHDVIAVRLLVQELAPPPSGMWRVRDPESGQALLIDWSSESVRDACRARAAAWQQATAEALARARVDRMDVPVPLIPDPDAVARPILDFFRMRERRGAHA